MNTPIEIAREHIDFDAFDGLIFDCDGTLSDSMPLHYVAWRHTMLQLDIEFAEERFYSMGGMPSEKIIALLAGERGIEVDAVKTAAKKEAAFASLLPELRAKSDVVDLAKRFRGKKKISLASGGTRPSIDGQLRQLELSEFFEVIVTAEDTERHKPEPDVFLEAARRMDVAPRDCLVFEDSPLGFAAAETAGMCWVDVRTW